MRGSLQLSDLSGRLAVLEVACSKCGRYGRYHLSRLIERHGAAMTLPDLAGKLSADCPESENLSYDRCRVYFPALRGRY